MASHLDTLRQFYLKNNNLKLGKISIIELSKNLEKREILIDELCKGITNTSDFRDGCEYIFENKKIK